MDRYERLLTIDDENRFVEAPKSIFLRNDDLGRIRFHSLHSSCPMGFSEAPSWLLAARKDENRLIQSAKSRFLRNDVSSACSASTKGYFLVRFLTKSVQNDGLVTYSWPI